MSNIQIFNNIKFFETKQGYHLGRVDKKPIRMHIYVWEYYNGCVPKGYDIHHIDKNKSNNNISNLELISRHAHHSKHFKEIISNNPGLYSASLKIAREEATKWHKSDIGRTWHKKHYKVSLNYSQTTFTEKTCEVCGKTYKVNLSCFNRSRFCSNKCKSSYRRHSGVDNIEATCPICGKTFKTNKYSPAITCGQICENILRKL